MHIIAAKAVCFKEALEPAFADYQRQIVANAAAARRRPRRRGLPAGQRRHRQPPDARRRLLEGPHRQGRRGGARQGRHHRQQERHSRSTRTRRWSRAASASARRRSPRAACGEPEMDHHRRAASRARSRRPDDDAALGDGAGGSRSAVPEVPAVSGGIVQSSTGRGRRAAARARTAPLARCAVRRSSRAPAQVEMAERGRRAPSTDGGVLLAEAGTGTGKTLAYLIPAILSRQRVLDLHRHQEPAGTDLLQGPPGAARGAGRAVHRDLHEGARRTICACTASTAWRESARRSAASDETQSILPMIDEWSRDTETGDRAEIEDLPEDLPFWNEISATAENCLGTECPRYDDCFVTRMRQRAAASDVVIVNHHLLVRGRRGPAERLRRGHSALQPRDHRRGASARRRRHAVFRHRGQQLPASTIWPATSSALLGADADRRRRSGADDLQRRSARRARPRPRVLLELASQIAAVRAPARSASGDDARVRIGPAHTAAVADEARSALVERRSKRLDADIALTTRGRAGRRCSPWRGAPASCATTSGFCCAPTIPDYVYFVEFRGRGVFLRASPIDVSRHRARDAARPDAGDRC